MPMEITNIAPVITREEWREWLAKNGQSESFCWVKTIRGMWGSSSKDGVGIPYLDAVEEALCFGWIDSTSKGGYQRFSPRTKKSNWTELNKVRAERLERLGLMTDEGRKVVPTKPFEINPDIMDAIKACEETYKNFLALPETYSRVRIDNIQSYIMSSCGTYEKRLQKFLENTKAGKTFGDWNDGGRLLMGNESVVSLSEKLIGIFERANESLLARDRALLEANVSERNLCGALMRHIYDELKYSEFSKYYVDVEYNRNNGKIKTCRQMSEGELVILPITCDLIVHSRGESVVQDNLIALEMKKSDQPRMDKESDRERIIALTKDAFDDVWSYDGKTFPEQVCRYALGIYYEINHSRRTILLEYYRKGKHFDSKSIRFG